MKLKKKFFSSNKNKVPFQTIIISTDLIPLIYKVMYFWYYFLHESGQVQVSSKQHLWSSYAAYSAAEHSQLFCSLITGTVKNVVTNLKQENGKHHQYICMSHLQYKVTVKLPLHPRTMLRCIYKGHLKSSWTGGSLPLLCSGRHWLLCQVAVVG
jgi:hypothetical protein